MKNRKRVLALTLASIVVAPAFGATGTAAAQTAETQRNVKQQQRIEHGLQSGQLTTKEAGELENRETRVERLEARAAADGTVSKNEAARINAAQNAVSKDLYSERHDAQVGQPNSAASKHMQAAVARDAKQQARISGGVTSGQLTAQEAAKLEQGQAQVAHTEAGAVADGTVTAAEAARIQKAENRQSRRIYQQRHDQQAPSPTDVKPNGGGA